MIGTGSHPLARTRRGTGSRRHAAERNEAMARCAAKMSAACGWLAFAADRAIPDAPSAAQGHLSRVFDQASDWELEWSDLAKRNRSAECHHQHRFDEWPDSELAGCLDDWGTLEHLRLVAFPAMSSSGADMRVAVSHAKTPDGRRRRIERETRRAHAAFGVYVHDRLAAACGQKVRALSERADRATWYQRQDFSERVAVSLRDERDAHGGARAADIQPGWIPFTTPVVDALRPTLDLLGIDVVGGELVEL